MSCKTSNRIYGDGELKRANLSVMKKIVLLHAYRVLLPLQMKGGILFGDGT